MSIRDILVHLDNSAEAAARLDLAIRYAKKHGAHLRGLYPITHSYYEPRDIGEISNVESIEALFQTRTSAAGISSEWVCLDWSVIGVSVTDIMILQAYYTDLVIVGQTNSRTPNRNVPVDLPERLVMACGRPVLIVPYAGVYETAAERVMIAWKPGRESVRTVTDALACIKKASYVSIIGVSAEAIPSDSDSHIIQVRDYLSRHNVTARTEHICAGSFSVGDVLLNLSCEQTVDLMVMGALAPNRRGVPEISPVARHVLKHMAIPVLMSH